MFKAPKWVLKRIEAIRRDFFWFGSGEAHGWGRLVAWRKVCRTKSEGGLGVLDLSVMNVALLCKWWWRLLSCPELQWCKLIKGLYYRRRVPLSEGISFRPRSQWWRDILSIRESFRGGLSFRLGDGRLVCFWTDRWCGETTLQSQCPELFGQVIKKSIKVESCLDQHRWRWRKILRGASVRDAAGRERVNRLKTLVGEATPGVSRDTLVWRWNNKGTFSVKSTYTFLIDGGLRDLAALSIWRVSLPGKVKIFIWLALMNRLPTVDNLRKKGWDGNELCVLCGGYNETGDHLFTGCVFSRFLFGMSDRALDIRSRGTSARKVWENRMDGGNSAALNTYRTAVAAHWWVIWNVRNRIIFQHANFDPLHAVRWINNVAALWTENF